MSLAHPMLGPAYYVEQWAFNPSSQPSNSLQKEVLSRVAAVVAPIFYVYQIVVAAALAILEATTCLLGMTDGHMSKNASSSLFFSIRCLFSSIVEIPHKFVNGPTKAPNYFGNNNRHHMINHSWKNQIVWN